MSQHDMNIANQGFPAFRSDLNNALTALVSTSSGATEPTTMFANQLWYDTATDTLKIRDEANAAWISVLTLDQTNDRVAQFLGNSSDTATAPSFTWGGDPNTGMYNPAADQIGLTTGGTDRLTITTAQFTGTLPWRGQAGTAAAPAISTSGDTNTGIFFPAADTIAFAEGGVEAVRINSDAQLVSLAGTALLPSLTATADPNTGVFYPAADSVAITTGGSERLRLASAGQLGIGGANYGTSGQVLTSNGAAAAPSWQAASGGAINVQSFDASGTWTKPSGYSESSRVLAQCWGGGGSGSRNATATSVAGGGGGGYNERWLTLSQMGATETVTIGAGGASRTGSNQNGDQGGNTTVGSLVFGYGGAGGVSTSAGGGGGGQLSAGSGITAGRPFIQTDDGSGEYKQGGGNSGISILGRNDALFHGGGGGYGTTAAASGSSSVWGGGGGGGGNATAAPGTSSYGGNGGAGGATGTAGTQPGGGGGGGTTTSGAGAAGRVIITVFPA